jgi:dipeptidyl aminopeptidase/acylaminoacyl peptidase
MTRHRITAAALLIAVPALVAAQAPMKVGTLDFADAAKVAEIDTDKLKGQPSRLAWSPDGSELYVQTMDGQFGKPGARLSHYVFKVENGRKQDLQAEPNWVSEYWTAKSGQASPDDNAFKIELKPETRTQKTVSTPMGGDLARGGAGGTTGSSSGDAIAAAYNQQPVPVNTMLLHGQIVGEFVNSVIVPGLTFGWGPKGSKLIAYSAVKNGRVVVMDEKGTRQEIEGTRDAILPAWSPEGTRLAWLQKDGRKKFVLQVVRVNQT